MVVSLWCDSIGLGYLHFSHFVTEIREIIPPTTHITSNLLYKWIKLSIHTTHKLGSEGYKYPNISINCEENVRIQSVAGMLEVSNGGIEVTPGPEQIRLFVSR